MSELTVTMLRLGLLALLWLFVISTVGVLRQDLFGTKLLPAVRRPGKRAPEAAKPQAPNPRTQPTQVTVVEGPLQGTTIPLSGTPVLVGRAPECTLVINDEYSSGRHLKIYENQGRWFAEDLNSTNGTFIGREQISGVVPVQVGTQLRIGRTVLELRR